MVEENRSGRMDQNTRVGGRMIWLTVEVDSYILMEMFTSEIG